MTDQRGPVPEMDRRGLPTIDQVEIPPAEYQRRLRRVQDELRQRDLQVGIGYGTPAMPGDPQYLSGCDPQIENTAFIVSEHGLWVVGGPEGAVQAVDQMKIGAFRILDEFRLPGVDYVGIVFHPLREVLHEAAGARIDTIGVLTSPAVMSVEWRELVRRAAGDEVRVVEVADILRRARYEKSSIELECHRNSNRIANAAFRAALPAVRPGVTELEVAAHADFVLKSLGAEATGFDTIVLSGERINTIIGRASKKRIEQGEPVLISVSARYEGYCSAVGRTLVAGGADVQQVAFLDHGLQAYELAAARLVSGQPARDVDVSARDYLIGVGLGDYHAYSVGHGTGLTECQEAEPCSKLSDYLLPRGIAAMVDVGIFGHPIHHGFRFENSFLIDANGTTECLTDVPMRLYAE